MREAQQKPADSRDRRDKSGKGSAARPSLWIELIPCTCGGQGQDPWSHTATCPRGRAIRKRASQ
jgi:hypothetical protein